MATITKVTKKIDTKKLKESGYSISFNSEYNDVDGNGFEIEELIYCCAIKEIGAFSTSTKYQDKKYHNQDNFNNFYKFLNNIIASTLKGKLNYTYMINSNGKGFCSFIDAYMKTELGQSQFTLVKSFINPNSNNKINIYISNNI
jgi:hypothetical protein